MLLKLIHNCLLHTFLCPRLRFIASQKNRDRLKLCPRSHCGSLLHFLKLPSQLETVERPITKGASIILIIRPSVLKVEDCPQYFPKVGAYTPSLSVVVRYRVGAWRAQPVHCNGQLLFPQRYIPGIQHYTYKQQHGQTGRINKNPASECMPSVKARQSSERHGLLWQTGARDVIPAFISGQELPLSAQPLYSLPDKVTYHPDPAAAGYCNSYHGGRRLTSTRVTT